MKKPSVVLAVFLLLLLTGCGQKGDLYFPENSVETSPETFLAGVDNGLF